MTMQKWFEQNGFNKDGITYAVLGNNTFAIKDVLKENGCKYNSLIKWHCAEPAFELPEGYEFISINFFDMYHWSTNYGAVPYQDAPDKMHALENEVKEKYAVPAEPSNSEYVGTVGDRLRNMDAVFVSRIQFVGQYGLRNIYTFQSGDNVFKWFSESYKDFLPGEEILLSGTVKAHQEYKDVKQTVLSRCIIKGKV